MNGTGDLKPGIQTTELWVGTILPQLIGVAVLFGWVKSGDAHSVEDAIKQCGTAALVLITNGVVAYKYIHSRWMLKSQHLTVNSQDNGLSDIPQIGKGK